VLSDIMCHCDEDDIDENLTVAIPVSSLFTDHSSKVAH